MTFSRAFPVMVLAALLCVCCTTASAEPEDDAMSNARLQLSTASLAIFLDVRVIERFLQYKKSALAAPTVVHVSFSQKLWNEDKWPQNKIYEQLWFHNGKTIGMKRFNTFPAHYDAMLIILPCPPQEQQTSAAANAIVHLLMDLIVAQSSLRTALVPLDIYQQVANDMAALNFNKIQHMVGGRRPIILHLQSYPQRYDDYFYYTGGESPM